MGTAGMCLRREGTVKSFHARRTMAETNKIEEIRVVDPSMPLSAENIVVAKGRRKGEENPTWFEDAIYKDFAVDTVPSYFDIASPVGRTSGFDHLVSISTCAAVERPYINAWGRDVDPKGR
jgi:hypothetical protein